MCRIRNSVFSISRTRRIAYKHAVTSLPRNAMLLSLGLLACPGPVTGGQDAGTVSAHDGGGIDERDAGVVTEVDAGVTDAGTDAGAVTAFDAGVKLATWSRVFYDNTLTNPRNFDRTNGGHVTSLTISRDTMRAMLCGREVDWSTSQYCINLDTANGSAINPPFNNVPGTTLGYVGLYAAPRDASDFVFGSSAISPTADGGWLELRANGGSYPTTGVVRFTPAGASDSSFVATPLSSIMGSLASEDIHGRVAFAYFNQLTGANLVRRYQADGGNDSDFGSVETKQPLALVAAPDGVVMLGTGTTETVTKFNDQGDLDLTFGTGGVITFPAAFNAGGLVRRPRDGALYVSGAMNGEAFVMRFDANGHSDSTWGTAMVGTFTAVKLPVSGLNVTALAAPDLKVAGGRVFIGVSANPACFAAFAVLD